MYKMVCEVFKLLMKKNLKISTLFLVQPTHSWLPFLIRTTIQSVGGRIILRYLCKSIKFIFVCFKSIISFIEHSRGYCIYENPYYYSFKSHIWVIVVVKSIKRMLFFVSHGNKGFVSVYCKVEMDVSIFKYKRIQY